MADFDDLKVGTGVGPYHLNRFRIAFSCPTTARKETLAADFVANFPKYLASPFATTELTARTFQGNPTLKFTGAMKLLLGIDFNPGIHHDWVARIAVDNTNGFTVQTLKRNFMEAGDAMAAAADTIVGLGSPMLQPIGIVPGGMSVALNRMHFLAGRRAWRIDTLAAFGENPSDYVSAPSLMLETSAVERFSNTAFTIGDAVVGFEKRIPPVWIALLENFVAQNAALGLKAQTRSVPLRSGWKSSRSAFPAVGSGSVSFFEDAFTDLPAVQADFEFVDVKRLFPEILPST
jgi:hypothetical protein